MNSRTKVLIGALCLCLGAACSGDGAQKTQSAGQQTNATSAPPTPAATQPVASPPKLDVPYVPTPPEVVAEMLKAAKVRKDDVLYDLGSGDGRILITAAERYGARGVGVDIDPVRIKEANDNARAAGVTDRVRFHQGDLFQIDVSPATVVTLYLLPDINLKLRPKLLRELRPGTRVISHNYGMGEWQPASVQTVTTPDGDYHYVYSWTVPEKVPPELLK